MRRILTAVAPLPVITAIAANWNNMVNNPHQTLLFAGLFFNILALIALFFIAITAAEELTQGRQPKLERTIQLSFMAAMAALTIGTILLSAQTYFPKN